jgi:putative Mg2+ transporter-C (MgtC) family protein
MTPEQAAFNLAVAFCLSAVIGFERQWRNRLAGLRTNTLVALGAATFVVFEQLFPDESNGIKPERPKISASELSPPQ